MFYSLPSLRPLLDVSYLPLTDMRIARTFCFTNGGQALYLCSPTEIQRITYSQEMCDNLQVAVPLCVCSGGQLCVWCVCVHADGGYWSEMSCLSWMLWALLSWALLHLGCNFCHTGCHSVLSLPLSFLLCLVRMEIALCHRYSFYFCGMQYEPCAQYANFFVSIWTETLKISFPPPKNSKIPSFWMA